MPVADERLAILEMTIQRLVDGGYEYIGMDHFAKPTDELAIAQKEGTLYRNFQGYSTKAGCGCLRLWRVGDLAVREYLRPKRKEIRKYFARIDDGDAAATHVGYRMTHDDHIRKETIMQLMCNLEIDKPRIEREFEIEFDKYFAADLPKLDPFIADGLLEETGLAHSRARFGHPDRSQYRDVL